MITLYEGIEDTVSIDRVSLERRKGKVDHSAPTAEHKSVEQAGSSETSAATPPKVVQYVVEKIIAQRGPTDRRHTVRGY